MHIETLKRLALLGGMHEQIAISSSVLASQLRTSPQTAARRLSSLEEEGCIERKKTGSGQKIRITEPGRLLLQSEYQDYRSLFEGEPVAVLRGRVAGGLGEGQYYISREGYRKQFEQHFGFVPYAGTLNIKLDEPFVPAPKRAVRIEGFRDEGRTFGECRGFRIRINGIEAAVIRPDRSSYPQTLVEVIAPVKLREVLQLADGDAVEVTLE
ncbi:Riboflavin kinase [uncultured archaeon]|nr:Riboflavin kinase [uncultured archaeon]